jgi:hypothetical protein
MAKVKIYLEPGETQRDVEEVLNKAFEHQAQGGVHSEQTFDDPAMVDTVQRMESTFKKIHQDMINEINEALDQDYLREHGN